MDLLYWLMGLVRRLHAVPQWRWFPLRRAGRSTAIWEAIRQMTYDPLKEAGRGAILSSGNGSKGFPVWYVAEDDALCVLWEMGIRLKESEEEGEEAE